MAKSRRISARIAPATSEKLKKAVITSKQGVSRVIEAAIEQYCASLQCYAQARSAYQIAQEIGIIGCVDSRELGDKTVPYKEFLTRSLKQKYGYR